MTDQRSRQHDRDTRRSNTTSWFLAVAAGFVVLALLVFGLGGDEDHGTQTTNPTNAPGTT